MRDYGVISPQFWIGSTGKTLRGNANAQLLALYLMTSPHANMIGVYHCPILYMSHETGIPFEGASEALRSLVQANFCTYDADREVVFVHSMAKYQIGDELKEKDNRIVAVKKAVQSITSPSVKAAFLAVYGEAFKLVKVAKSEAPAKPIASPFEAPSKPGTGTGTGTGVIGAADADAQGDDPADADQAAKQPKAGRGSRLPDDWVLPKSWGDWALSTFSAWTEDDVRVEAEKFADHWRAKAGKDACKTDWQATWRNWCRSDLAQRGKTASAPIGSNWRSNPIFAGVI